MKPVTMAVGIVTLLSCTGSGSPEVALPDSALLEVPADPAAAPQPLQADSLARLQSPTPTTTRTAPTQSAPTQRAPAVAAPQEPPKRQPPQPHDTRPSIPWPPDTV